MLLSCTQILPLWENKSKYKEKCYEYAQNISEVITSFVDNGYNRDHFAIY